MLSKLLDIDLIKCLHCVYCRYVQAESYFKKALAQVKQVQGSVLSSKWESLVNNLGHTCRKLGKFQESLEYHQQALVLQPMTHSTYAAIGYAHALLGDLVESVEAFHRALSLKRDDTFSKSMLNYVIEQLMGDTAPFEGKNTIDKPVICS